MYYTVYDRNGFPICDTWDEMDAEYMAMCNDGWYKPSEE